MTTAGTLERVGPKKCGCGLRQQQHRQRSLRHSHKAVSQGQQQTEPQGHSRNRLLAACRRETLLGLGSTLLGLAGSPAEATVTSDIVEGTGNIINIGMQSYGLWMQSVIDGISNDDQTGVIAGEKPRRKKFGSVRVPGLSSFSFIDGTLVGGALILLLALTGSKPGAQQQQQQQIKQLQSQQQLPEQLAPEVESALRRYLSSPETSATFHDPAVHAAIQEVRSDIRNITKYRNDPAVMQAFEKLLEIEDILERL